MDIQPVIAAILAHQWLLVASLVIGLCIRASKDDVVGPVIPSRARPYVALALGILSGVIDAAMNHKPILQALIEGLIAGGTAILGHNVFIEGVRKGKELPLPGLMKATAKPPSVPPTIAGIFLGLALIFGFHSLTACKDPATAAIVAKWTGTAEQLACVLAADVLPNTPEALSQLCFDGQAVTRDIFDLAQELAAAKKKAADPAFKAKVAASYAAMRTDAGAGEAGK